MTSAELFHRAGAALFGDQYVAPMAVALGVDKNTVGKWAAGKSRVPAGVWPQLYRLITERLLELPSVGAAIRDIRDDDGKHILPQGFSTPV